MNYKKLKVLGVGMFGTTYLIEKDGIKYALKTQHILASQKKKDFKYELWRELDLYNYISKLNTNDKKFFTQLYDYKIYNNCNHKQKRPFKIVDTNKPFYKILSKLDKSTWCVDMLIDYHGKWTCSDYLAKYSITSKQCYSLILQIIKIVSVLYKGGYSHNDLHLKNIMIKKTSDKYFTLKNKKIPYRGLQLIAIDYGEVLNKKFKMKYNKWTQEFPKNREKWLINEIKGTINNIINNFDKYIYNCRKQNKKLPWEKKKNMFNNLIRSIIEKHPEFWNQSKKEFIEDDNTRKIINKIENTPNHNFQDILNKSKLNHDGWTVIINSQNIFRAKHPKLSSKYEGWCSYHKLNIPVDDYIKITKSKNTKELVKFALSKV